MAERFTKIVPEADGRSASVQTTTSDRANFVINDTSTGELPLPVAKILALRRRPFGDVIIDYTKEPIEVFCLDEAEEKEVIEMLQILRKAVSARKTEE